MKRISGILLGLGMLGLGCGQGEEVTDATKCVAMPANTIYVAADSTAATPDGTTWSKAFKNLQAAIDAGVKQMKEGVVTRVTIAVKQGTYQPTATTNVFRDDLVNSLATFSNLTQADIWGGFKGQSLCKEDQDKNLFETTILSGVIDGTNVKKPAQKNALHVLNFFYGLKTNVDIKMVGFKVTGGMANNGDDNMGGGAAIASAGDKGIVFDSITFDNNQVTGPGGGVFVRGASNLTLTNSKFMNNDARFGGALYISDGASNATVSGTTFINNTTKEGTTIRNNGALLLNGYKGKENDYFKNNSKPNYNQDRVTIN